MHRLAGEPELVAITTATMPGVYLPGERRLEIREVPVPEPGHGQVLVRMRASSICGSDLRAIYRPRDQGTGPEAYRGVIAGHEPAGEVERIGPGVTTARPGDRVLMYHIAGCGLCHDCRSGWMIACSSERRAAYGWQRDGGHATYLLAEERTLVALPEELSYLDGSLVACGLGTAYAACRRLAISGADRVLVTGLGPVGMGAALLAQQLGAEVVGVEASPARRELAERLGIEAHPASEGVVELLRERTAGHGFEVTLDCSGNESARRLCLAAAREWGRVGLVGEGGSLAFDVSPLVIHPQLTVVGSWVCSIGQMEELVELLVRWKLRPDRMVTHRFALADAAEAYALADRGEAGKIAFVWD
ncbi:MAG TPA: zinc-binding dehydrogenase [Candidatus Limnocylindria bacterium]|nr:zinc-binding dehydrogenase [Candidatus Limnocylindria bacterium]